MYKQWRGRVIKYSVVLLFMSAYASDTRNKWFISWYSILILVRDGILFPINWDYPDLNKWRDTHYVGWCVLYKTRFSLRNTGLPTSHKHPYKYILMKWFKHAYSYRYILPWISWLPVKLRRCLRYIYICFRAVMHFLILLKLATKKYCKLLHFWK